MNKLVLIIIISFAPFVWSMEQSSDCDPAKSENKIENVKSLKPAEVDLMLANAANNLFHQWHGGSYAFFRLSDIPEESETDTLESLESDR